MRALFAILALATLGLAIAACGGASKGTASGAAAIGTAGSIHKNDRDNDSDNNDDDAETFGFGHAADANDQRASAALITRYFAAAAEANGTEACSLLVPQLADSVVEDNSDVPGPRGTTCAAVVTRIFKLRHRMLVEKSASLRVVAVRVEGDKGLDILEFPEIHEDRQIAERRVGGRWRVLGLLDGIIE